MIFLYLIKSTEYLLLADHFLGLCSLPETILELAGQSLHVSLTSSSDGSASLGLLSPVVVSHLFGGVSTARACLLLDVVTNLPAATASRVGLIMPFSERCGTFRHLDRKLVAT